MSLRLSGYASGGDSPGVNRLELKVIYLLKPSSHASQIGQAENAPHDFMYVDVLQVL